MKIAFYYDLPKGGALVHTLGFLAYLQKHHQVTVFTPVPPRTHNRLQKDLQCFFWSLQTAKKLANKINAEFDLAYVTHDRFMQAPWILRYLHIPTLHYSHNPTRSFFEKELGIDPAWPLPNQLYEKILRTIKKSAEISCAKKATMVVTSSKYMVSYLEQAYSLNAKLAYPGVDLNIFHPLNSKKQNRILLVGNNESQKSLDLAISALSLIPKRVRPGLTIVSPRTKLSLSYIKKAKSQGVDLRVYSQYSPNEMNKLYNSCLLTISTALREPYGLSIVESMAAGTPVLVVNQGGFRETVEDGVTGWLVDRDAIEFAGKLTHILRRADLVQIGKQGRERVKNNYSLNKMNQILLKLLLQLPKYPR